MKKLLILSVFFIFSQRINADTPIVIKQTFENVNVYVSVPSFREDINKGLIIGKYISELSKELNYKDSIQVYLDMKEGEANYKFYNQNFISLHSRSSVFDLFSNLKLVEYAIHQKKLKHNYLNSDLLQVLKSGASETVRRTAALKVERPDIVNELQNQSIYSYYFQNDYFHIYKKDDLAVVLKEKNLYYFSSILVFRPLIFLDSNRFYYMDLNGVLRNNKFSNCTELKEKFRIYEASSDLIIFNTQNCNTNAESIAVLKVSDNKIIDKFDWNFK